MAGEEAPAEGTPKLLESRTAPFGGRSSPIERIDAFRRSPFSASGGLAATTPCLAEVLEKFTRQGFVAGYEREEGQGK